MSAKIDAIKIFLSNDQRKTERLLLTINIYYSIPPQGKWIGPLALNDIGGKGLGFKIPQRIKKNTPLHLKIELPTETKPIEAQGRVAWCKRITPPKRKAKDTQSRLYNVGIQFTVMSEDDRQKFTTFFTESILSSFLNSEGEIRNYNGFRKKH